jgi:hypothetical protein
MLVGAPSASGVRPRRRDPIDVARPDVEERIADDRAGRRDAPRRVRRLEHLERLDAVPRSVEPEAHDPLRAEGVIPTSAPRWSDSPSMPPSGAPFGPSSARGAPSASGTANGASATRSRPAWITG